MICGHKSVVVDMVDAVLENRDPKITPEEGIKSVCIINAIYESAKSGKKIYLEELSIAAEQFDITLEMDPASLEYCLIGPFKKGLDKKYFDAFFAHFAKIKK